MLGGPGTLPEAASPLSALGGAGRRPREPALAKRVDDLFAVDMGALDAALVGVPLADLLGVDPATRKVRACGVDDPSRRVVLTDSNAAPSPLRARRHASTWTTPCGRPPNPTHRPPPDQRLSRRRLQRPQSLPRQGRQQRHRRRRQRQRLPRRRRPSRWSSSSSSRCWTTSSTRRAPLYRRVCKDSCRDRV